MRFRLTLPSYEGKRVWLSGHTGFKGSWMAYWLSRLGARVHGFALTPPTQPSLFEQLGLEKLLERHEIGDVRDRAAVRASIVSCKPDFVFHLAAQPLVRLSYQQPVETFEVNLMGSVNVMESLRGLADHPCAAVVVTTDKCYENREWLHGYREEDPLGGYDPYSASKATAEIAVAAYRRSFFHPVSVVAGNAPPVALASARAGNVIGGGDWALDRIVPDCVRALATGAPIQVRNPRATRPWQHVLEPVGGYLSLGAALHDSLHKRGPELSTFASAFNFGPDVDSNQPVGVLVEHFLKTWPGQVNYPTLVGAPHEAGKLHLTTEKAYHLLGWRPRWDFSETVARTAHWYRTAAQDPGSIVSLTAKDIADFSQ